MGEHRKEGELGFDLLSAVASAAAASNTRVQLERSVHQQLEHFLPLQLFALPFDSEETAAGSGARTEATVKISRSRSGDEVRLLLADGGTAKIIVGPLAPDWFLSKPLLETLGRILYFGKNHCRLIERLARMSSTAHHVTQSLRQQLRRFTEPDEIVAHSSSMQRVLESADLVAGHDTTVLLRGESGTGKELLARRIHRLSRRGRHPFISVNCGALPETLIESELFGYERGAFTGAVNRYRGRFERAHHGTLFLDEVAELPPASQIKLLRVLQEGEFERLGGEETVRVDVRVVAATNQPLEQKIENGSFRADLFYRINVFPIVIPPLRERAEDIPILAQTLAGEAAKRLGCPPPVLRPRSLAKLMNASWPGNVRELANTIERTMILSRGQELEFADLPVAAGAKLEAERRTESFEEGARRLIQQALDHCGGKIYGENGAAACLGIPPSTLQGKMRRLRMNRGDSRSKKPIPVKLS